MPHFILPQPTRFLLRPLVAGAKSPQKGEETVNELRRYELYVVLRPDLEDEELETAITRLNTFITSRNGLILGLERRGRRRLAYPIKHHLEGYDVLYDLLLPPPGPAFVENQLRLSEQVLRYLLVRRDDLPPLSPEEIEQRVAAVQAQLAEAGAEGIVAEAEPVVESATAEEPGEAPVTEEPEETETPEPVSPAEHKEE